MSCINKAEIYLKDSDTAYDARKQLLTECDAACDSVADSLSPPPKECDRLESSIDVDIDAVLTSEPTYRVIKNDYFKDKVFILEATCADVARFVELEASYKICDQEA